MSATGRSDVLRFAYADPPYIGCGHRYPEGRDVNHRLLVRHLEDDFDGWALSLTSASLREVLSYVDGKHRVAAWCKRYAVMRPNVWPVYAWEPVIYKPVRKPNRGARTPFDYCVTEPAGFRRKRSSGRQEILGEKPPAFVYWLLEICRVERDDEIIDVFPGSGAVADAVSAWRGQGVLFA